MTPELHSTPAATSALLTEEEARYVLLARAFEEADERGVLLPPHERARAVGDPADGAEPGPGPGLVRRARRLTETLEKRAPIVPRLLESTRADPHPLWVLLLAALAGLFTNAIGPSKEINVLAAPLVLVVLWNLGIYTALPFLHRRGAHGAAAGRGRAEGRGPVVRGFERLFRASWLGVLRGDLGSSEVVAHGAARYVETWQRTVRGLLVARLTRLLHLAAIAMVLGIIAGMYLRGLVLEYHATWESTFLSAHAAERVLRAVLAPALFVTGTELPPLPDPAQSATLSAAPWIHLHAVTAVLLVLIPRSFLAWRESRRARQLAAAVPIDLTPAYYRRLVAPRGGSGTRALVLPYGYRPAPRSADALKALLHDVFGARADLRTAERLDYGDELEDAPPEVRGEGATELPDCVVVLFGLSQTPESEVHGRFLEALRERVRESGQLLVLVDGSPYARRLEATATAVERMEERRRAWNRVVRDAGLEPVHIELAVPPSDELVTAVTRGLWPVPELAQA